MHRRQLLKLLVFIALHWIATPQPVAAQVVPNADLSRESLLDDLDVNSLAAQLGLTDEKHLEVLLIVDGFVEWRRAAQRDSDAHGMEISLRQQALQEQMGAGASLGPDFFQKMRAAQEEWRQHRARTTELAAEYMQRHEFAIELIKTHLTQTQQLSFDAVLRDLRRERTRDWNAFYPAERVDLLALFNEPGLLDESDRRRLDPTLARYAEDLDLALRLRNEHTRREPVEVMKDFGPTSVDEQLHDVGRTRSHDEIIALTMKQQEERRQRRLTRWRPIMASHRRVAEVNQAYFRQCLDQIQPEVRESAERAFRRLAYAPDRIEAPLSADKFIAEVLSLESLQPEQRVAIESLRDDDWWPRRRVIEAVLMRQDDERAADWERYQMSMAIGPWIDARRQQIENRRNLQREIIDRVNTVLSDAQREQVNVPQF